MDLIFLTKREVLDAAYQGQGPLGRCGDDEPVFILRAQDESAPRIVAEWARQAEANGASEAKVGGAREIASEMAAWQNANGAKLPD